MKKLAVLFTLITVIAVMTSMMLVPAYADDTTGTDTTVEETTDVEETTAPEESEDPADSDTLPTNGSESDTEKVKEPLTWSNLTEGARGYIAIAIAVVLLVGTVTAIVLLAPKKGGKQK